MRATLALSPRLDAGKPSPLCAIAPSRHCVKFFARERGMSERPPIQRRDFAGYG